MPSAVRRLLVPLLVVLAGLATLGLAACGGEDDPQDVLRETFSGDKEIRSGDLDVAFRLQALGGAQNQPVDIRLTGPFASTGENELPRFDLDLSFSGGTGQTIAAGALSTGSAGFLEFQGRAYEVPEALFAQFRRGFEQAQREPQQQRDRSLAGLGVDPTDWLRNPRTVGSEEVGGTDTTHVTGTVDVPRLLTDIDRLLGRARELGLDQNGQLPQRLGAEERQLLARSVRNVKVDVWSGEDDRILRRMRIAFDVRPQAQARGQGQDARQGSPARVTISLGLNAVNEDQEIEAPENARPLAELLEQFGGAEALQGLVPGGGGSAPQGGGGGAPTTPQGGGGGTTPPPGGGTIPGANQQYLECAQEAGESLRDLQRCSRFLD